jgi:hypothetical protein
MSTDPEPFDSVFFRKPERAVVKPDANRPNATSFFEVK